MNKISLAAASAAFVLASAPTQAARADVFVFAGHGPDKFLSFGDWAGYPDPLSSQTHDFGVSFWSKHSDDHIYSDKYSWPGGYFPDDWRKKHFYFWGFPFFFFDFDYDDKGCGSKGNGGGSTVPNVPSVPEPATWAMILFGFFGMGGLIRSARRQALETAALGIRR